jgi:ATP-dependent DNA helicase RecG
MQTESTNIEYKSLRKVVGNKSNVKEVAETCVCLANAQGGTLFIGVEDKSKEPPEEQVIKQEIVNTVLSRLRSLTDSVGLGDAIIEKHENGGEYFHFKILPSSRVIATTSSGKILLRIQDKCVPITGEEVTRLAAEKNAFQWELVEVRSAKLDVIPRENIQKFTLLIRASDRVKQHVKEKDDYEILVHYNLVVAEHLTNLGILWLGTPYLRSRVSYPVTAQYIVYDEYGDKIRKETWHDYQFNPYELILNIEEKAAELNYSYEFPQGLFRKRISQYAKEVVRELLVNAVAHKKFTISGDIFIEVHSDRLEITNPGNLPLGITKDNILHSRHRRNPQIIRIFHDLGLMEGEGSGYDLIYEIDSKDSKPYPKIESEFDFTRVIQSSKILDEEVVYLLEYLAKHFQLSQKQFIVLGIIAREKKILSTELSTLLQLSETDRLRSYVSKLVDENVLITRGQRKGTQYLINPELIKASQLKNIKPSLKTIELHPLMALIEEDLKNYTNSSVSEISGRIPDIPLKEIRKAVYKLVEDGRIDHTEAKRNRTYFLAIKK